MIIGSGQGCRHALQISSRLQLKPKVLTGVRLVILDISSGTFKVMTLLRLIRCAAKLWKICWVGFSEGLVRLRSVGREDFVSIGPSRGDSKPTKHRFNWRTIKNNTSDCSKAQVFDGWDMNNEQAELKTAQQMCGLAKERSGPQTALGSFSHEHLGNWDHTCASTVPTNTNTHLKRD